MEYGNSPSLTLNLFSLQNRRLRTDQLSLFLPQLFVTLKSSTMSDLLSAVKADTGIIITTGTLFLALTTIVVAIRIVSRPLYNIKYGLEDWFLLAGVVLYWVQTGLQIACKSFCPLNVRNIA